MIYLLFGLKGRITETIKPKGLTIVLVLMTELVALLKFIVTWFPSSIVRSVASTVGLPLPIFLLIIGLVGCLAGFYALYIIYQNCIRYIRSKLPIHDGEQCISNGKRNWFFPVSACAFFSLNIFLNFDHMIGVLIAVLIAAVVATQFTSIWKASKRISPSLRIVSFFSAIGIVMQARTIFYSIWGASSKLQTLGEMMPIRINIALTISVIGALLALYFVYICVLIFWNTLISLMRKNEVFKGISKREWIVYAFLFVVSIGMLITCYLNSNAFYGPDLPLDVIYTSDSSGLFEGNAYMSLMFAENDLRQPLFAVFAAPFTAIPYLLTHVFSLPVSVQAIFMNGAQVCLLITANFILAKMLKLSPIQRVCFMVALSCTYMILLFTLVMEQYIVAYFWLIFCLFSVSRDGQPNRMALWGAGGTLLTSMILLPTMTKKNIMSQFKDWFTDMWKYAMEFVVLMLAFCRFDVFAGLFEKISSLTRFTGHSVSWSEKFFQYTTFVRDCFFAPHAQASPLPKNAEFMSWHLDLAAGISLLGILILLLCVISIVWNWKKKSTRIAAGWALFSVFILFIMGWGTQENGLILYSLYFGWAFYVLLFQLVEKVGEVLRIKALLPIVSICAVILLLVVNVPGMMDMLQFAVTYYPV